MAGAASQTRPEPMNASPYHSKVKVTLRFADTQFIAGGMVTGKIELECKAEKGLGISVIMVELFGVEELTSRDHSATSTFLHSRRLFQGPGLPPSNSVHPYPAPGDPPLPSHYYHARRGITTFLFQIPLPETSPSSIDFGSSLATLRYEVRASVGVFWKGEKKLVTDKKMVDIIERLDERRNIESDGVIVGENGKIWMQGRVLGGLMVAGEPTCIELQVKNHTTKKNSGLSVTLTRELYLPNVPATQKQPLQISDTLTSVSFKGPEYIIGPGVEGVANLVVDVPKTARGVRGGRRFGEGNKSTECLFEVRCTVGIKLGMGIGSKDIYLNLPAAICHPAVVPDFPPPDLYSPMVTGAPVFDPATGMFYQPPMSPGPYGRVWSPAPYLDRAVSPVPYLDRAMSPYPYQPPISPPIGPYVDHGQVWLPPPTMPSMYAPPSYYGQHDLYAPAIPFAPPRPSSTEPAPSRPMHELQNVSAAAPLIPMPTGSNNGGDREEGKGERASRIATHLRMSSRARSASPPAHRYHVAEAQPIHATIHPSALHAPDGLPTAQEAFASPMSSPELHSQPNLRLSPLLTGGDVVSPRPMLSPKISFSKDPFEAVSPVENLERLAETATPVAGAMSPALSQRKLSDDKTGGSMDKTLPRPPVPSTKEYFAVTPRGRADTLFPLDPSPGPDQTPPTPTLAAANTSLRPPRGAPSGLDALEARLLAEVGTRKPEKARAPDVREVLGMPAPIAIPRPADVEPPVDSAISSLSLPGLDDARTLKRAGLSDVEDAEKEKERERARERTLSGDLDPALSSRARGSKETMRARESKETMRGMRESRETKKAGGSGGARQRERKKSAAAEENKEVLKLRKAAQGRIAAWLGSIDPDAPPQIPTPPLETPSPVGTPELQDRSARGRSKSAVGLGLGVNGDADAKSPARSPAVSPARSARSARSVKATPEATEGPGEATTDTQASPNPRSSGFLPIGTIRAQATGKGGHTVKKNPSPFDAFKLPKASDRIGLYPPRRLDPEVKYDIRSARGGKGGIVTSVAALWAQGVPGVSDSKMGATKPTPIKPSANASKLAEQWKVRSGGIESKPATRPKPAGLVDARPKAMRPTTKAAQSSPAVTSPSSDPMSTSFGDLTAKRARMVKATPAIASVSSSMATPTLSSTASLARPIAARAERAKLNMKLPPTIAEAVAEARLGAKSPPNSAPDTPKPPSSLPAKADLAFGQARLRELIKRYQGQVNS
ncbi:uncharacterized protein BXZ73DRAFT_77184 [Epithele typhae]|uniref:uncharacterized protein n=1 Tax=Epithele typhae TaxID=378194 RepID=UPI0020078BBA|nr:uncharacterized protein BXZ73DRAFT_77184 [Epithele typhae]KAH9933556.1 hypothetical protein BXZ73DRAFT_77184 [Epithele typhae]